MRQHVLLVILMACPLCAGAEPTTRPGGGARALGKGQLDPSGSGPFVFVVIGNPSGEGSGEEGADPIDFINRAGPEAVFVTGDTGRKFNDDRAPRLNAPCYAVPGNHDLARGGSNLGGPGVFRKYYGDLRFSVVHRGVHFIGLNSEVGSAEWLEQADWLKQELERTAARWRFVFLHNPHVWRRHPIWTGVIHPLLARHKTVAAFGSHHGEYFRYEADGIHYIANRVMNSRGLDCSFIKVTVPAEGRPTLTLMAGERELPDDFAKEQSDVHQLWTLDNLQAAIDSLPPVFAGDKEPLVVRLPIRNPSRTEQAAVKCAWRAGKADPSGASFTLPPAGSRDVEFRLDVSDPALERPQLAVEFLIGSKRLSSGGAILTARRGIYVIGDGEAPEQSRLRVGEKRQITDGRPDAWSGPADLSAVAVVRRTPEALRVSVEVTDDRLSAQGRSVWQNDAVELLFDFRDEPLRGRFGANEPGVLKVTVQPNFDDLSASKTTLTTNPKGLKLELAAKVERAGETGYRVEVVLPLAELKEKIGEVPERFHFDFCVGDADGADRRDNTLYWSCSSTGRDQGDVRAWGRLAPHNKD